MIKSAAAPPTTPAISATSDPALAATGAFCVAVRGGLWPTVPGAELLTIGNVLLTVGGGGAVVPATFGVDDVARVSGSVESDTGAGVEHVTLRLPRVAFTADPTRMKTRSPIATVTLKRSPPPAQDVRSVGGWQISLPIFGQPPT